MKRLESSIGTAVDVVWSFENSRFYDMRFAGKRLRIYHQVDLNQNFHPAVAARTADICFCTTETICRVLQRYARYVFKIDHGHLGVEKKRNVLPQKSTRFEVSPINVVYIGNLDIVYLDVDLIRKVVENHSAVLFHFVGTYHEDTCLYRSLKGQLNTCWWGRVDSGTIPEILAQADILLIAYKAHEHRDQLANPHKLMEYLASGKVVVATYTDEYRDKRHLLEMVDSNEEFAERFAHVVQHLDVYNSAERQAERRAYAADNTYQRQIERIFDHIRRELPGRI